MKWFLNLKSHHIKNVNVSDADILTAKISGEDPWWELDNIQNEPCYIDVEMKFTPIKGEEKKFHHCKVYFLEEGMAHFDEAHSITIPFDKINHFSSYKFKCLPFQTAKITKFRFDPAISKGDLTIRKFRFVPYATREKELGGKPNVLLLSFFARSGSTLLMKMLVRHPEITGYNKGTHEGHIVRYFSRLYYMIKTSHLYTSDYSEGPFLERMKIFSQHYREDSVLPKPVEFFQHMDLSLFRNMYADFISSYLPFLLEDVDAPNRMNPKFYVEKHMDGMPFDFTRAILELFPESKILMLFRDPRDVFLSFEAFSKKEKIIELEGTVEEKIERLMGHYKGRLSLQQQYKERAVEVFYEDIVSGNRDAIHKMLSDLGLNSSDSCIDAMLDPLKQTDLQAKYHETSAGGEKSIQRWKQELNENSQELFSHYDEIIEMLGYERTII